MIRAGYFFVRDVVRYGLLVAVVIAIDEVAR